MAVLVRVLVKQSRVQGADERGRAQGAGALRVHRRARHQLRRHHHAPAALRLQQLPVRLHMAAIVVQALLRSLFA